MKLHRMIDRVREWWRYPQPSSEQRSLLGLHTDSFDLDFTARRLAAEDSAQYMVEYMRSVRNFVTDYDLHEWIGNEVDPMLAQQGLFLEFGVATGRTLNHWARLWPSKIIHGFDGFQGLPEDWIWNIRRGHFRQRLPWVRSNCELVVGWFNETMHDFLGKHTQPLAFLHIDCDLYSSTVYVLEKLHDRMQSGTIIVFDEYFNFPGWRQDEFRAWQEFCQRHDVEYEYIGMVTRHQQVAVRVIKIG